MFSAIALCGCCLFCSHSSFKYCFFLLLGFVIWVTDGPSQPGNLHSMGWYHNYMWLDRPGYAMSLRATESEGKANEFFRKVCQSSWIFCSAKEVNHVVSILIYSSELVRTINICACLLTDLWASGSHPLKKSISFHIFSKRSLRLPLYIKKQEKLHSLAEKLLHFRAGEQ